ncbi:hypothetical protein GYY_02480 [Methanococcus maripaludis X1]|uniref:Glycosyltransferase RgtA/B/C/D-like domain-containing protein n=1 Tax=Methanococcus maripaludis X1 TaxID=1053692 RepID=G0H3I9_METMI|nr:hypothetical protein [Methanococcus maripaludis]AEK19379.1 hypothetical protein GYY_02480 [Methanococcus maripaludis X1]
MGGLIISKLKIPYVMLILYILLGLFLQYSEISGFQSLPSPIYGGDYYYQMGSVNHILSGGNPFESSSMMGGIPGYLPLYGVLCAGFCKLFGLDAFNGMIYFSLVIFALSSLIWFNTFKKIFKNEWVSVIGTILANGISMYPILKYTPFTKQIMIPLFILALYSTVTSKKSFNYVFLGIIYGLLAISHTVAFVGATLIIATFLTYEMCKYNFDKINGLKEYFSENWKNLGIFIVVGLPISMLYWYKPLFVYKLHQVNDLLIWNVTQDWFDVNVQINFLFGVLNSLINFNSVYSALLSLFFINGLVRMYKTRTNTQNEFLKIFGIGCIFATFSYFITIPLLNMHFVPNYMANYYMWSIWILISLYGLNYLNNFKLFKNDCSKIKMCFSAVFIIFLILSSNGFISHIENDPWITKGYTSMSEPYLSIQSYLLENTAVNDTIISTKELSFALNGISGRKLVVNRWAQQNNPYMDFSERDIDASIILYGNNTPKKLELIKKYDIKYLYWDTNWINLDYRFSENNSLSPCDPLITFYNSIYEKKLDENGVKYYRVDWWVDPSLHDVSKFDLLMISPENYRNSVKPWKEDLDPYLEEVWNYSVEGHKIAVLYKMRVE